MCSGDGYKPNSFSMKTNGQYHVETYDFRDPFLDRHFHVKLETKVHNIGQFASEAIQ